MADRRTPPTHPSPSARPAAALALPSFERLYWLTAVVALLVASDLVGWWFGLDRFRSPWGFNLSFAAALIGGARFVYHATCDLLDGKLGTDLALALALVAALLLNEQWVAAEVVLIALVGESLEAMTLCRTQRELRKLLELQPLMARVQRDSTVVDVPLQEVRAGEVVIVRPGERLPVDGEVVTGRSSVDQSTLTGESVPVDKEAGSEVFAGTLNQFGALHVRVTRVGEQSALGQVLRVVTEARRNKAEIERQVDRLTRYFLPAVLLLAAGTFALTNRVALLLIWKDQPSTPAMWEWMPTLAVLVVTCPCALVLATPATMLAAFAWLARRGVLVTGGAALERLAAVTHFAFDKTGTLTQGQLRVAECIGLEGVEPSRVLQLAATAEQVSEHLIAQAILRAAREQQIPIPPLVEFQAFPGVGVHARQASPGPLVHGPLITVGSRRLHKDYNTPLTPAADAALTQIERVGLTPLLVSENGKLVGVIGVGDTVRPEAADVLQSLRRQGIADFVLLSGDRSSAVQQVAQAVGIDRYVAELLPAEKANWISDWREGNAATGASRAARSRRCVAMVGDGANDAPALTTADVGIALRSVGSEIAAEAGDVILLGEPLRPLPAVVGLARETVRVIHQNVILFAFGANLLGITLTAWMMPTWSETWRLRSPVAAALFHQVGSVLVLVNAMRFLWFERWQASWLARCERFCWDGIERQWQRLEPLQKVAAWSWRMRFPLGRLAFLAGFGLYLTQILVLVQPDEMAIVRRLGRFHAILPPGPHLRLPPPFDQVVRDKPGWARTLEVGLRRTGAATGEATGAAGTIEWNSPHSQGGLRRDDDEVLVLTGDRSLVELAVTIQYQVADLRAYRFSAREPERILQTVAESVVREIVATQPLLARETADYPEAELLSRGRGQLEREIAQRLQQRLNALALGVRLLDRGVCLQDVHPPLAVVDAFRDVSAAYKERERMKNEADAYRRDKLIQAAGVAVWRELTLTRGDLSDETWTRVRSSLAGEAYAELTAAESFAEQRTSAAAGDAEAFAFRRAAHATQPLLTEWRLFMDTVGVALATKPKLVFDPSGRGRRHLLLGLPAGVPPAMLRSEAREEEPVEEEE